MTHEQELAATQLLRAFRKCHSTGLNAGIYDGSVCVWPADKQDVVMESGRRFFDIIHEHGRVFNVRGMFLDGGAGV